MVHLAFTGADALHRILDRGPTVLDPTSEYDYDPRLRPRWANARVGTCAADA